MALKIGSYVVTGHQGLQLEKLRAQLTTGTRNPVLKPRSGKVHGMPSLSIRRTQTSGANLASPTAVSSRLRIFPKWKPEDRFILSFEDDNKVIREGAAVQAIDHSIPVQNCFHSASQRMAGGTGTIATTQSLVPLTAAKRLDLHAHGNKENIGKMSPGQLAEWLHKAGLRSVGVLKIHACDVGKGDYLGQLKNELTGRNIEVGYLSGPKGSVADMRIPIVLGNKALALNVVRPLATLVPIPFAGVLIANKMVDFVKPEPLALHVVKGNINIAFPGTRYSTSLGRT